MRSSDPDIVGTSTSILHVASCMGGRLDAESEHSIPRLRIICSLCSFSIIGKAVSTARPGCGHLLSLGAKPFQCHPYALQLFTREPTRTCFCGASTKSAQDSVITGTYKKIICLRACFTTSRLVAPGSSAKNRVFVGLEGSSTTTGVKNHSQSLTS